MALAEAKANIFLKGAKLPRPILNIAHAGASSLAPQNTLIAGKKALSIGADLWEIDVRITNDGHFILMHDQDLKRTTNAEKVFPHRSPWPVKDFTLSEIRQLDAGSWFVQNDPFGQIKQGNVSPTEKNSYRAEKVPTLQEALQFTKENNWRLDIEVKPMYYYPKEWIAKELIQLINTADMATRVMVTSFDHQLLKEIKERDSTIPTGALMTFSRNNLVEYLEGLKVDAYLPSSIAFNPKKANELKELGYGIYVWTYNRTNKMRELVTLRGISGIITDFPQRLQPILDEKFGL